MRYALCCAVVVCLALPVPQTPAEPATLISGAIIVDGTGKPPQRADLLIRGERIAAIGEHLEAPPGATTVDASGMALLPGLFDVHTHLPYATAGRLSADWPKNLKAYLYCGVTSVADFGTYPETFEPMRRLIRTGAIPGPRLSLAARITTPGGHGAEGGRSDIFSLEVLTPREARAAVRRVVPYHPDAIKVFTDGWRYGSAVDMTSMEEATLAALVEEAHANGIPVLTHTVTLERAKIAARAKVDVIAHGVGDQFVDDELARLMKASGTWYASTLAVFERKARGTIPPLVEATLEPQALAAQRGLAAVATISPALTRRWTNLMHNVAALRGAGVAFAAGTDAGMPGTHHGYASVHELELLVQGGLTPLEAIAAATGNSARALRVDKERGTVEPGKLADIVLVDGRPWERIADIEKVRRVFLGGREIDRERLRREIATDDPTPLAPVAAAERIDDFESADGRSPAGALWVNSTDGGHDRSRMSFTRTLRAPGNHAITAIVRMAEKEHPYARLDLPLTPGAVVPADAHAFQGVEFETRGEGQYTLVVQTQAVRNGDQFSAAFQAGGGWTKVRIPFASLRQARAAGKLPFPASALLSLSFEIARPAGKSGWLELDNLRFYK
jgi:imidazolonepropionase-like amidohydrolase